MAKQSTFNISLKLLTEQFNKGLKNVQRQLKGFGNFVKGAFAIGSIVAFGRKVIETGAQFEDAMARVRAVSNATAGEMAMMTKEAERLGSTTKYTASEAAGALENLTRNGMSASDATTALSDALKLAQANAIGLAEAADIITNTMNIFGLEAKDAARINDVLSATCANSATNITLLAEAVKGVGPIAKIMGKSIEETSAALGVLANRGVTGSEAGKALSAMFQRLSGQSPKAAAALKRFGIEIDESKLKTMSMNDVLNTLANSGIGNSVEALQAVFGKNYASTISTLINSVEEFNRQLGITEKAAGTTTRMFEQGVGSTENAIKSLQSAFEGLLNSIFKRTSGVFNSVIKGLTDIIRAFTDVKTRTTAIVGAIVSLLTVKLVKAIQKTREEALKSKVTMSALAAGITTVKAAAQAAYAAMGGWVGLLVTIGTTIATYFVNKFRKMNEVAREVADIQQTYAAETKMAANELQRLHKIAEDENMSLNVRKKAIEEITKRVKDYHAEISNEGKLIEKNKDAIGNYIKAIDAEMKIQAKQAALQSLYNKQAILETDLLADARLKATTGQKIESALKSLWMQMLSGNRVPAAAFYGANITDTYQRDILKQLNNVNELIKKYTADMTPEELEKIVNSFNNNGNENGPGGGGGSTSSGDNADEKFIKAKDAYTQAISEARLRWLHNISTEEEYNQEMLSAQKQLIDAYVEYAASVEGIEDDAVRDNVLQSKTFKQLQKSYNDLKNAIAARAQAENDNAKKEEKQNEAWKKLDSGLERLGSKQGKTSVQNPWDSFSSNPKEYRAEEREVQKLQTELENLKSTYESLKDAIKDIGEPQNEKQVESLKKWNELLAEINEKTAEYQQKANALGSKKAMDEINEKTIEQRRAYYDVVRNTTSAVGQLANSLQSLSQAEWDSPAEAFNALTNAIFGTVDAVLNVIDTWKKMEEVVEALTLAKQQYAAIEQQTSQQAVANAAAEAVAAEATGAAEVQAAAETIIANKAKQKTDETDIALNIGKAATGAAASQASIPYVGPILAAAAAATIISLLMAAIPKYANGGIIQGSSKYGDKLLARVNAGEAILNQRQQKRLLDIADGRGGVGGQAVQFHISGKDLVAVLRNNNSANSRIAGSKGM